MSDIYFSNFQLEEDTEYFLYIGELKNYGLNTYLKEALSHIFSRKFDFIAIIPDIFEQYDYENLIVINPHARTQVECLQIRPLMSAVGFQAKNLRPWFQKTAGSTP